MNHRNNRSIANATAVLGTFVALVFSSFVSILLLKYIIYENGSFSSNIFLLVSIFCIRCYLFTVHKPLRTHEIACLFLFVLYERNLLDFFNVFLLLGVKCIRQQMHHSPPLKEIVTFAIGLIFLLMGWFSVGRVLVIYTFSMILLVVLTLVAVLFRLVINHLFYSKSNKMPTMNGMRLIEQNN